MVLVSANSSVDLAAVVAAVDTTGVLSEPLGLIVHDGNSVRVTIPGGTCGLDIIAKPIPTELLSGAAAVAWQFPDAQRIAREHQSHVVIHVTSSVLSPLTLRLLCTRLTVQALLATNGTAVLVPESMLLRSATEFLVDTAGASATNLPVLSWVGVHPVADGRGGFAYTTGMRAFGHYELESRVSQRPPEEVLAIIADVAHHVLLSAVPVRDGDTVGHTATQRLRVRLVSARILRGEQVLRIEV